MKHHAKARQVEPGSVGRGQPPRSPTSHYAAAKAGVIGVTRHLALEVGADGITVNAVAPGTTATERVLNVRTPEETRRVAEAIPVRRLGEPAEIAEAVVFLASERAAFITGATLDVNGGQLMAGAPPAGTPLTRTSRAEARCRAPSVSGARGPPHGC